MKQLLLSHETSFRSVVSAMLLQLNTLAILNLEKKYRSSEGIHQARLCFKRSRAVIRMVRPGLSDADYTQLNDFYRQCGQSLGVLRDTTASIETLRSMLQSRKSPESHKVILQFLSSLRKLQRRQQIEGHQHEMVNQVLASLVDQQTMLNSLELTGSAPKVVYAGIRKIYRQGKLMSEVLASEPDNIGFHQLRKKVKYLGYMFETLQYLYPALMKSQLSEFTKLGRLLGSHHDLVILLDAMVDFEPSRQRGNLRRSIINRKKRLESRILDDAAYVFMWKPAEFAGRVRVLMENYSVKSSLT